VAHIAQKANHTDCRPRDGWILCASVIIPHLELNGCREAPHVRFVPGFLVARQLKEVSSQIGSNPLEPRKMPVVFSSLADVILFTHATA